MSPEQNPFKWKPISLPKGVSINPFSTEVGAEPEPPTFSRTPRNYIPYPDQQIEIQAPPNLPSQPASSLISLLLPMGGMVISVIVSVIASSSAGNPVPVYAFISLPMFLFSVGGGIYNFRRARKKYETEVALRNQRYQEHLQEKEELLVQCAKKQHLASLTPHPDIDDCLRRAQDRSLELWEREPGDPDFLEVRLGTGSVPSTFSITLPTQNQVQLQEDPLIKKARELKEKYENQPDLAVNVPLTRTGSCGVVGQSRDVLDLVRAMVCQISVHHAPNEVKIVAIVPNAGRFEWDWIRFLPHNWSDDRQIRFLSTSKESTANVLGYLETILKQRENQRLESSGSDSSNIPAFVILFADPEIWRGADSFRYGPLIQLLLKKGNEIGAYPIFLTDRISRIPKACGAVVDVQNQTGTLRIIGPVPEKYPFRPDQADIMKVQGLASSLAPLKLAEAGGGSSNLPDKVTLFRLLGVNRVDDLPVYEMWNQNEPHKTLSVPIGIGAGGKTLFLNLHEKAHGPHGLVAGTTGSGKTALLSTFIAVSSVYYHPHELAFIGIDFKGGDLVRELRSLPHLVGVMTNLDSAATERAIKLLRGEIRKRQNLFNQIGVGNIYDYQKLQRAGSAPQPLPHLVIICDEFAELKKEQPDFIRELVSIARVGRSLGLHLILATQKPAGVVSDEIWSNSHFHLCLKVASLEDSREMLKRPEAAQITQQGRAYFQVGMNEVFELFQAAWGDAPYHPESIAADRLMVREVELDGRRQTRWPKSDHVEGGNQPTQIQVLVKHILETARTHDNCQRLNDIWLPPLPDEIYLEDFLDKTSGWNGQSWTPSSHRFEPVLGLLDDPINQRQCELRISLERTGHIAIFGAPGTGKTIFLQTLITSLVHDHSPKEINLYVLDFGGRNLKVFEPLPHIGAVIYSDELERVQRLVRFLEKELERRKKLVEKFGNMAALRSQSPDEAPAEIVVILDGYSSYAEVFKNQIVSAEIDAINRLAAQGGNLGIHLIVTTDLVKNFPAKLLNNIAGSIAFELNDAGDYIAVVGKTGGLVPARDIGGRGLLKGVPTLEFQTALPYRNRLDLENLVLEMSSHWNGDCPTQVPPLPEIVSLGSLLPQGTDWEAAPPAGLPVPLGLELSTPDLQTAFISLTEGPHFWISGGVQSGKSSMLQTWLLALAEKYSRQHIQFFLFDMSYGNLEALNDLPHTVGCINNVLELKGGDIRKLIGEHVNVDFSGSKPVVKSKNGPRLVLAIDGFGSFHKNLTEQNREFLTSLAVINGSGFHIIAAGGASEFGSAGNPLGDLIKSYQSGFWLGNQANETTSTFNFQFRMGEGKAVPRGTAFHVHRGSYRTIQVATSQYGSPSQNEWIRLIANRQLVEKKEAK